MKSLSLLLIVTLFFTACGTRSTESTATTDSLAMDSSSILADTPAPSILAFSPITGYTVNNTVGLQDSVNFIFLSNQQELDSKFVASSTTIGKPDFVINYNLAIVCLPSKKMTTITVDKVELGDAINVYLSIQRGAQQAFASKATQLVAIERRDGYGSMQFYVNGKEAGELILPVN